MNKFALKLKRRQSRYKQKKTQSTSRERRLVLNMNLSRIRRDQLLTSKRNITFNNNTSPSLTSMTDNNESISENEIQEVIRSVLNGDDFEREYALSTLKDYFSVNTICNEDLMTNVVNLLFEIVSQKQKYPNLQIESLHLIANLSCGTFEQTEPLINSGIVRYLLNYLTCDEVEYLEIALLTIGNLLQDSIDLKDEFLTKGFFLKVLNIYSLNYPSKIYKVATWILTTLCQGSLCRKVETYSPIIEVLTELLTETSRHLIRSACSGLASLCDKKVLFSYFCKYHTFERLLNLLNSNRISSKNYKTKQIVLFALSQLIKSSSRNFVIKELFSEFQIIDTLNNLFDRSNNPKLFISDLLLVLRRSSRAGSEIIQQIISCQILNKIFQLYQLEQDKQKKEIQQQQQQLQLQQQQETFFSNADSTFNKEFKYEMCWMLFHIFANSNNEQYLSICKQGAIQIICDHIYYENDLSIIRPTLKTINTLCEFENLSIVNHFDENGVLQIIDKFTQHNNLNIRKISNDIIDNVILAHSRMFENDLEIEN
ncbi:importin alpha [Anaeramoeba flamelloides]|uniref:Importin alpha n=1 Tax=Anaeramoeba flamelloides TaxID=1746091 RepID=A0AAV7YR30_9EUKA|nr:importin alpha [Anaeramoeba flamelloides]